MVSGVWSDTSVWCLVSGRTPVFGVWCLVGHVYLVSGVWSDTCIWCLVSGRTRDFGVWCLTPKLPLMKPPFWGSQIPPKEAFLCSKRGLKRVQKPKKSLRAARVCACAHSPTANGGRPPHGGKKVASVLPKNQPRLRKILPEFFFLRPVSVDPLTSSPAS